MNIGTFPLSIDSGVAVLTLDRPFCLDIAGKHALSETFTSLRGRNEVRALIIASGNQQCFLVNVAELAGEVKRGQVLIRRSRWAK
jgi:hypothetical protein